MMIIFYENLKKDVIIEMKRVYEYFEKHFNLKFPNQDLRLKCLLQESSSNIKQKSTGCKTGSNVLHS